MSPLFKSILLVIRGTRPRTALLRGLQGLVMLALVASLFLTPVQANAQGAIPTFSIVSVATDDTVTIQTHNFPADEIFTVRMGAYGTLGIGGIVVATTNTGAGGSFEETYDIPDELAGSRRIAIRMDGSDGYFAYNWFWNNTSGGTSPTSIPDTGGYSGIPTFRIVSVAEDETVSIRTSNYPAGLNFTVRIGAYGTLGKGGIIVGTTNSGAGGTFEETYDIPEELQGSQRLAIRMDAPGGFFAYNWFWNNTSDGGTSPTPIPDTGYSGIPTFKILSVEKDDTVTVRTNNFPPDLEFTVRMGAYGTLGIGGIEVATTNSGDGGAFEATYDIPEELQGRQRIAIRMDAPGGYFAYNWFWNNTAGGTSPTAIPDTGGYTGIPTFKIQSVVQDETVEVLTHNFPADLNFTVRMGPYGSLGIGGVVVATTNSGAGGDFTATYDIPDSLQGSQRIAVRMEAPGGYFAYNWFWNNSTP